MQKYEKLEYPFLDPTRYVYVVYLYIFIKTHILKHLENIVKSLKYQRSSVFCFNTIKYFSILEVCERFVRRLSAYILTLVFYYAFFFFNNCRLPQVGSRNAVVYISSGIHGMMTWGVDETSRTDGTSIFCSWTLCRAKIDWRERKSERVFGTRQRVKVRILKEFCKSQQI